MNCLFVINALSDLEPTQTTALMIKQMAERGHAVFVAEADAISLDGDNQIHARVVRAERSGELGPRIELGARTSSSSI